jgi:molybdenum cofactor biosynthesis protein B
VAEEIAAVAADTAEHPVAHHKALSPAPADIRVAVITASDSRTPATNEGGRLLRRLLEEAGFRIVADLLLTEEPDALRATVTRAIGEAPADVLLITGGTGLAPRDRTPDAIAPLFERRLPGFGELFRMLSFQEIGAAAMLSRADAGVIGGALVFLLPGSPAAVELAMRRLILPELAHAIGQLRRGGGK